MATPGPLARGFAWLVVALRLVIVPAWITAAVVATLYLPGFETVEAGVIGQLVPASTPALRTEETSLRLFRVPIVTRTAIVQRDPNGLSREAHARVYLRALELTESERPGDEGIAGALPVTNALELFPGSTEESTTAITFLFFRPEVTLTEQAEVARRFAAREVNQPDDALIGVTGAAPARDLQEQLIFRWLPWVEAATVAFIGIVVGVTFRSILAPLTTLLTAAVAYLVTVRAVAWAGQQLDVSVPADLEPVIVVLLLGIVTDYCIFYLSGTRTRLAAGQTPKDAARDATAQYTPIIFTAGLLVAGGSAALLIARLGFLRAFGPGLALTVLISLVVAMSLMPALLALLGRAMYWPRRPVHGAVEEGALQSDLRPPPWRRRLGLAFTRPSVALFIALVTIVILALPTLLLWQTRLGFRLTGALPENTDAARAQEAAAEGFAAGILGPTEVLFRHSDRIRNADEVVPLEQELQRLPGVAAVIGPSDPARLRRLIGGTTSTVAGTALERIERALLSRTGDAARFVVIFDSDPLGHRAIENLERLKRRSASILRAAGFEGASLAFAGDTALAQETIALTATDLRRIGIAMVVVDLVLFMVFLRALIAPLYLLLADALAMGAALGLTTLAFQTVLGPGDITYYVPFAVAVLLFSLGSDYNVFVVGRIWEEARYRPLREAVAVAAPRAARSIGIAAFALAGSFALLAIVPLDQFREFAFAMVVGVLIDSFVVRAFLVPALISLFGRAGAWPGNRLRFARRI
jgi:RND superfamily putative drug exporter